jgi:hypothetical protein
MPRPSLSLIGALLALSIACEASPVAPTQDDAADSDDGTSSSDGDASSSSTDDDPSLPPSPGLCEVPIGHAVPMSLHAQTAEVGDDLATPPACGTDRHGEEVSFAWTAPAAGSYRLTSYADGHTLLLAVWSDCAATTLLGCARAEGEAVAQIDVELSAGDQVAIVVDDAEPGGSTEYALTIGPVPIESP